MARSRITLAAICCLLALLVPGLAGCSSPSPQGFIWSSADGVAFLTWTSQNGQLSGTYSMATTNGLEDDTLVGQQQDANHVNLQIDSIIVNATLSGTLRQIIELNGSLAGSTMQTIDTTTGDTRTWYAGTGQQYKQIQTAYRAFVQVQYDLHQVQGIELITPEDSSPNFYQAALSQAEGRVKDEQNSLAALQQQDNPTLLCSALEEFSLDYPPSSQDSMLQLPMWQPGDTSPLAVVDRSTLAHVTALLSIHGHKAQSLPLPAIAGLSLPWKIDLAQITQEQTRASQQLATLKSVILTVASQLSPLRAQAQQIQAQAASLRQEHQCLG